MEKYYIIVLSIALLLLILVLTYVGLLMRKSSGGSAVAFPPVTPTCPDYWTVDGSFCVIPSNTSLNTGDIYDTNGNVTISPSTYGLNSTGTKINFSDAAWTNGGITDVCNKKNWANLHGIVWDGVNNYNSC